MEKCPFCGMVQENNQAPHPATSYSLSLLSFLRLQTALNKALPAVAGAEEHNEQLPCTNAASSLFGVSRFRASLVTGVYLTAMF